jgi:hypothetical protein
MTVASTPSLLAVEAHDPAETGRIRGLPLTPQPLGQDDEAFLGVPGVLLEDRADQRVYADEGKQARRDSSDPDALGLAGSPERDRPQRPRRDPVDGLCLVSPGRDTPRC